MSTKQRVKWWKVTLAGAACFLFLLMFIVGLPAVCSAHGSFVREVRSSGFSIVHLYSESAGLYYFYFCMELFNAAGFAISLYALFRCFRPAAISAAEAGTGLRRWRRVTYICLAVFAACIVLLFLYRRLHPVYDYGIANGGDWKTAADLIIPGWIGIVMILSLGGTVFSLIRQRETKKPGMAE